MQSEHHPVFQRFTPWTGARPAGFQVFFIGDHISTAYEGGVSDAKIISDPQWPRFGEEYFEWIDVLESVETAGETFTMLELGAGYGRWSVRGALAAKQRGKRVRLGCAEAEPRHVGQLEDHFSNNGLAANEYRVFEVAVSDSHGEATFKVGLPEDQKKPVWYGQSITSNSTSGAEIVGEYYGRPLWRLTNDVKIIYVPTAPASEIIAQYDHIDLVDMDIQGAEAKAIAESIDLLSARARRLHIGTHGTAIEQSLRDTLGMAGWTCTRDFPFAQENDTPYGRYRFVDGVQTWMNPRFA